MNFSPEHNMLFDLSAIKVLPKKTEKERELFNKWRHVLSREKVSDEIVKLYNKDLKKFLASEEGQKYKE